MIKDIYRFFVFLLIATVFMPLPSCAKNQPSPAGIGVDEKLRVEEEYKEWLAMRGKTEHGEATDKGLELIKARGCTTCHSIDGSWNIGPTFKGIFGRKSIVVTDGLEREVVADEGYLRRAILEPNADVVKGFPPIMPKQEGLLTTEQMEAIIEYLKIK
jgi:cytochrome c oxidase subunit 2